MSDETNGIRRSSRRRALRLLGALPLLGVASLLSAQESAEEWVDRCMENGRADRRAVHCEVREATLPATGSLDVDAHPNGGIRVSGWDRDEVLVRAKVRTQAESDAEARELASGVRIETGAARVRADGPPAGRRRGWSVSYEVFVPHRTDLTLRSLNGGIAVREVEGRLNLATTNGGIDLEEVAGDVRGETSNGGLDVRLSGDRWTGAGLDLRTANGAISLTVPDGYSARLVTGTVNGRIHTDIPLTVQGRIGRRLETDLGSGGAPVRVITTNGAVRLRRG